MRNSAVSRTEFDLVQRELEDLKRRMRVRENDHEPTVPIYLPDVPDDPIEAQIALVPADETLDSSATDVLPAWVRDGVWRPFSSASAVPFASFITNVSTSIPNNTLTDVGFGNALGIYTNRSDIFAIDSFVGGYGVGIHAEGFYMTEWTVSLFDLSGHRVATPEVEQVYAEDGSALELLSGMFLGSNYAYGYHHPGGGGGFAEWDVVWARTVGVASSTVSVPIRANVSQTTGETLEAFAYVQVTQLDPTTLGL